MGCGGSKPKKNAEGSTTGGSSEIDEFNKIQLDAHNKYRAAHGAPPVVYDKGLAAAA